MDSLRTAAAAVIAALLARMLKLTEFYWAPISTIVIVQSTVPPLMLGWQRFVGTALGAVLGVVLATFFPSNTTVYGIGVAVSGLLAWSLRLGPAYRFTAITLSIILLVPRMQAPWITGWHRFVEVTLGIAVGVVVTTLWPLKKKVV